VGRFIVNNLSSALGDGMGRKIIKLIPLFNIVNLNKKDLV